MCGGRIGVYEPVVVVTAYGSRHTSRAREPEVLEGGAAVLHAECYGSLGPAPP
jgi:hypothetical protein